MRLLRQRAVLCRRRRIGLVQINWLPKPVGTGRLSTSLIANEAAVLPSLLMTQVVSSTSPLTTSAFWIDGFCSDGF